MGDLNQVLSDGKWVVHNSYGVGQIRGYETKMINGKEVAYYRVETENSTFWVPLDQLDSDRLRPLSTKGEFKQAIKILELPPREMDPDHTHRKGTINTVRSDPSLEEMARLVRDLNARCMVKDLNSTEKEALSHFTARLLEEWSACMQISVDEAHSALNRLLQAQRNQEA
jgi:RNA polymerase-interacting CarD/CdnL/TRCF family regulator